MHSKLSGKKSIPIAITLVGILISISLISLKTPTKDYFLTICRFGFLIVIIQTLCLMRIQKSFFTSINLVFASYVLFQFGIPIIFVLNSNYSNPFLRFFDWTIMTNAVCFSLMSIQVFSLSILMFVSLKSGNSINRGIPFARRTAFNDSHYTYSVGFVIFVLSSLIVVPLYTFIAYSSITSGFSQAIRSLAASNGLFNLARAFFAPAFYLLLCYGETKKATAFAKCVFFIVAVESLLSGARTDGILWILVYIYYKYTKNGKTYKFSKKVKIGVLSAVLVILAVYIAQSRMGNASDFTVSHTIEEVLEEMGFNYTSICFVMLYVPGVTKFQYGLTYLNSILCLIPNTLDVFGIFEPLRENLPTNWLWNMTHLSYSGSLDFGVGFSSIGETYMNFGYFGLIVTFIIGYVLCKLFRSEAKERNNWERYVQLVLLLSLLTFPRRSFNEFLKSIEYSVLFMGLIIYLFYGVRRKRKIGVENRNEN